MKTKILLTGIFLLIIFSFRANGQGSVRKALVAEPSYERNIAGLDLKIWVYDKKDKVRLFGGKDEKADTSSSGMGIDREATTGNEAVTAAMNDDKNDPEAGSTHEMVIQAKESKDGPEIEDLPKISVVSPSKDVTVIQPVKDKDKYNAYLTLPQKGEYEITVTIPVNGAPEVMPFKYTVK